jgi:hypothetical protein
MATILTLPQQMRQETTQSGSYQAPANMVGLLSLRPVIDDNDVNDPQTAFWFRLYLLDTESQTWKLFREARFQGAAGLTTSPGWEGIEFSFPAEQVSGRTVRAELDVPVRRKIGLIVDLT